MNLKLLSSSKLLRRKKKAKQKRLMMKIRQLKRKDKLHDAETGATFDKQATIKKFTERRRK